MGRSSSTKSTTNTVAEPWKDAQPSLRRLLRATEGAFNAGEFSVDPYSGQRVADQGQLTQAGLGQIYDKVTGPNQFLDASRAAYGDIMQGDAYRDLDTLKSNVLGDVIPAVTARFASSGMGDSSMAADTIARSATEALAPIEYGAWSDIQNRKLAGMEMAPRLVAAEYLPEQTALTAGQFDDAYNQSLIDADMAQYYEGANQSYDELQRAANLMLGYAGLGGSTQSTSKQPSGSNPLGSAMQGLGGLGLMYSAIFGT